MNVAILGLWHLGSVTAACTARHHAVVGIDFDAANIAQLAAGRAPLHEPGLDDLLAAGLARGALCFSVEPAAVASADVLWVCYDTPVDSDDRADAAWVVAQIERALPHLRPGTPVLLSSQLPVGTCARLAAAHPHLLLACSPENLRLGKAIDAFEKPARIVVGAPDAARATLERLLAPIGAPLLWMRPASAEMVKHALNGFLALSIAFINEIATVAETVGADAAEISAGLKSEPRIGPRAYLGAGGPFAGGTLARDVVALSELGAVRQLPLALIPAIKQSNDRHRSWAARKISAALADVPHPTIAVLGLAYTPGTSTLRRSAAVELCRALAASGATVRAFDPLIRETDAEHRDIPLVASPNAALAGAHAVAICTEWSALRELDWPALLASMARPVVVDANRHIEKLAAGHPGLVYLTVGRP
ncbi:MAG: UDP-glucose/GDP-mannose dehydrogenase family protein [Candidatus Didemnitutus sp.]|nr:UDP-glucose/GDP-mannose dehydrogenase family protein [Candidatus Didemnitutus sp.]